MYTQPVFYLTCEVLRPLTFGFFIIDSNERINKTYLSNDQIDTFSSIYIFLINKLIAK